MCSKNDINYQEEVKMRVHSVDVTGSTERWVCTFIEDKELKEIVRDVHQGSALKMAMLRNAT